VTFDGSSAVSLYLNGQLAATASWTGTMPIAYEILKIGANRGDSNSADTHLFNGLVDEVHIFNRGLSAAEVAAIYGSGSAGLCP
jgi:hypothetical protein